MEDLCRVAPHLLPSGGLLEVFLDQSVRLAGVYVRGHISLQASEAISVAASIEVGRRAVN
jgi:hypothetical protein